MGKKISDILENTEATITRVARKIARSQRMIERSKKTIKSCRGTDEIRHGE